MPGEWCKVAHMTPTMSSTFILIDQPTTLQDLALAIGTLLGVTWKEHFDDPVDEWVSCFTEHGFITLGLEMLLNCHEDPFAETPFCLRFEDANNDKCRVAYARSVFEQLKVLNVPLLLEDDAEGFLDEWRPLHEGYVAFVRMKVVKTPVSFGPIEVVFEAKATQPKRDDWRVW